MTELPDQELVELLLDVKKATALLPEDERKAYEEAQESVVRARREAERWGHTHWIG
jgi:hypothetical protein